MGLQGSLTVVAGEAEERYCPRGRALTAYIQPCRNAIQSLGPTSVALTACETKTRDKGVIGSTGPLLRCRSLGHKEQNNCVGI